MLMVLPDNTQRNRLQPTNQTSHASIQTQSHSFLTVCESLLVHTIRTSLNQAGHVLGHHGRVLVHVKGKDLDVIFPTPSIQLLSIEANVARTSFNLINLVSSVLIWYFVG